MLFHRFRSQEERRALGGSDFLELQACSLPAASTPQELVDNDAIHHWENESLYILGDDSNEFYEAYSPLFGEGLYADRSRGLMDLCGVNYYSPAQAAQILARIEAAQPPDCPLLLTWLRTVVDKGFYLLGV